MTGTPKSRKWKGSRELGLAVTRPQLRVSWVGAVDAALRAQGADCDPTGVAGFSGYAFLVNIGPAAAPGSVTAFDWKMLAEGLGVFGLAVEINTVDCEPESGERESLLVELFERVREEIDRGLPCVLWGAGGPGFAVVSGYQQDSYLAYPAPGTGAGGPEPVRFDALAATGRLGAVFFGEKLPVDRSRAEHLAVARAGQLLDGRHPCFEPGFSVGSRAFEYWAEELAAGNCDPAGSSENLNCFGELQGYAAGFCRGLGRARSVAAGPLAVAAESFQRSADRLAALGGLFSFPGPRPAPARAREAAESLRACAADNRAAAAALHDAAALL